LAQKVNKTKQIDPSVNWVAFEAQNRRKQIGPQQKEKKSSQQKQGLKLGKGRKSSQQIQKRKLHTMT